MTKDERKELASLCDEVRKLREEIAALRASQPALIPYIVERPPVVHPIARLLPDWPLEGTLCKADYAGEMS